MCFRLAPGVCTCHFAVTWPHREWHLASTTAFFCRCSIAPNGALRPLWALRHACHTPCPYITNVWIKSNIPLWTIKTKLLPQRHLKHTMLLQNATGYNHFQVQCVFTVTTIIYQGDGKTYDPFRPKFFAEDPGDVPHTEVSVFCWQFFPDNTQPHKSFVTGCATVFSQNKSKHIQTINKVENNPNLTRLI